MAKEVSAEHSLALRRLGGARKLHAAAAIYWKARKLKAARLQID